MVGAMGITGIHIIVGSMDGMGDMDGMGSVDGIGGIDGMGGTEDDNDDDEGIVASLTWLQRR